MVLLNVTMSIVNPIQEVVMLLYAKKDIPLFISFVMTGVGVI